MGPSHPQIPQRVLTFHLNFSSQVKPVDRGLSRLAFDTAVEKWEQIVPDYARFQILPPETKQGIADFEVVISPEQIDGDDYVLGMYDGHYTKDLSRIHGTIYIITEKGHWAGKSEALDFWEYEWIEMHEIGHLLGLGHHCPPHGIMDYFRPEEIAKGRYVGPSPDEIQSIKDNKPGLETQVDKCTVLH